MELVFVYGTLKSSYNRNEILEYANAELLGKYKTEPIFTMVDLGAFPAVLLEGTTSIEGEVYKINEDLLSYLDVIEGTPNFYQRIQIETSYGKAWMYYLTRDFFKGELKVIENGVW